MAVLASACGREGNAAQLLFDFAEAAPAANLLLANLQRHQPSGAATPQPHASLPHPPAAVAPARLAPPAGATHLPPAHSHQHEDEHHSSAARLNEQLLSIESRGLQRGAAMERTLGGTQEGSTRAVAEASLQSRLSAAAMRVGDLLQPQGEALGDSTWAERTANVLTSLPFVALGWHMLGQRLTPEGRHHAHSMVAVGVAASLYHASSGRTRRVTRKIDYWTIAYTSSAMTKALFSDSPNMRRAANLTLLALPFRPFAVSTANTLIMQTEFARQAMRSKAVRVDLRRHYAAAVLGVAAFFGEDMVAHTRYSGFVHSAWHCLATYSMYTTNSLLAHKERVILTREITKRRAEVEGSADKPLRRPLHSSASSLPSFSFGRAYSPPESLSPSP